MRLYGYQREAVDKMHNGCILNGTVGSGKSLTSLAYYYEQCGGKIDGDEKPMSDPMDLYIITTAKKRDSREWNGELCRFHMSTDPLVNQYSNKVVIDSWNKIKNYVNVKDAFFIFDEQKVSSFGTWGKSFIKIARHNKWILLTATAGDTWTDYIPVFVANGFYRNKTDFAREHIVYSRFTKYPKVERYLNTGKLLWLRDQILVPMKFKRATVKHDETIFCDYDKSMSRETLRSRWDFTKNEPIENAASLCFALRRICNGDESRGKAVVDILEKHPRAIIFYNFDYELEDLRSLDYRKGTKVAEWNGHNHQEIPNTKRWVYLVHYNSCEGWNCITTDTMIFYSLNYSYKTMAQASGRIDRLNTPYTDLYYYHLKSHSGIDTAITKALRNKKKFNESAYFRGLSFDK